MPVAVNSEEDELSCVMLTDLLPVFVNTAACMADCPTLTLENVNAAGVICISSGVRPAFDVLAKPAQPLKIPVPVITAASSAAVPALRMRLTRETLREIPCTASPRAIFLPSTSVLLSVGRVRFQLV